MTACAIRHPSDLVNAEDYRKALYDLIEEMLDEGETVPPELAGTALRIAEELLTDYVAECGCVMLQHFAGRYPEKVSLLLELGGIRGQMIRSARHFWGVAKKEGAA